MKNDEKLKKYVPPQVIKITPSTPQASEWFPLAAAAGTIAGVLVARNLLDDSVNLWHPINQNLIKVEN